jgi:hypothetical protein
MKPKVQRMIDCIGYAMSSTLAILVGYDVSAVYSPGDERDAGTGDELIGEAVRSEEIKWLQLEGEALLLIDEMLKGKRK